ncbi:GATA zinc finger domain-containing protein 7-like [Rhagoletis pomonella]|uniref:GATA zinc finger domain-containing protein 7-like n=1 Tax=Rhagoletis pomonella TaxID=28610 RepID=UPI0017848BFB|nr:GATA zinc finger domain-containing protein 7-like [Rhagoletis pomonella]
MRFTLRRNANVLDTLLSETLQILLVFSIMGWPFSGMQQCETKGMNAERVQQDSKQQQQQQLDIHLQHQQQQSRQQYHKPTLHITQRYTQTAAMSSMPVVVVGIGPSSELAACAHGALPAISTSQQASSSMSSSLGTHDVHSPPMPIITKDYQHKSAASSTANGNVAYTQQPIATATSSSAANEAAAHFSVTAVAAIASAKLSNENVNDVSAQPADISLLLSLAASPLALHALHRVTKDTQHSSVNAELSPISSSESTNDSHEIDNMDYVMSKHIASLTRRTTDDAVSASLMSEESATPRMNAYASSNSNSNKYHNNNNSSININDYNSDSSNNNQTQDNLMSLSLLSLNDHNMEMSAMRQEMVADMSLTSSKTELEPSSASSLSSSAAVSLTAAAQSASLTSADLSDSFADSAMAVSTSNHKSAYDRSAVAIAVAEAGAGAGVRNQTTNENHYSSNSNNNNMQHLGSQRIALKTTAKTKTTLATEQHQHAAVHQQQHNSKSKSSATLTTAATAAVGSGATGRQRSSVAKKVESKYVLPKPQKTDAPMLNYIFDTFSSANKHHHHDQRYGPHFEDVQRVGQPTNMTVQAGSSIHLNCRISLLQDKTVSWVRRNAQGENALDLLTVGLHTYTGDKRYKMEFQYPNNWRLKITNVKKDDEAMYECQISTHPPRVIQINLFVNAPKVMIVDEFGDPLQEKYYEIDSTLQLSCVVRNVAMATSVVFWKHGDDILNYDVTRGGISVKTELMDDGANSTLSIAKINKSDSGNYTCAISDFQNFSIVVHILNGESFAELHHGAAAPRVPNSFHQLLVVHCVLLSSLLLLLLLPLLYAPHQPYTLGPR